MEIKTQETYEKLKGFEKDGVDINSREFKEGYEFGISRGVEVQLRGLGLLRTWLKEVK